MSEKVRGLTVPIEVDATAFKKGMKELQSSAKTSQGELDALQKSLELNFDADKLARAQKVAQDAIDKTSQTADALRQRLKYLEGSGKLDSTEYSRVSKELTQTEDRARKLEEQLKKINSLKFTSVGDGIQELGGKIEKVGQKLSVFSAAAAGALTAGAALGANAIKTGDDLATLATQYETTAEAIQEFNYVALQTDVNAEDLYKGLVKIRSGLADIATGTSSSASAALQQLGLDFSSFDGTEETFYAIVEALAGVEDKTQMVALANDIFGDKLANSLLPLFYAGTDAINGYRDEFSTLGGLTNEQCEALGEFDNVLNKIKTQFSNVGAQIGASFMPILNSLSETVSEKVVPAFQRLAGWFGNLSLGQQKVIVIALALTAALGPLTVAGGKLVSTVGSMISSIPKLYAGLSSLAAHPIVLTIAAVIGLLVTLYMTSETFRSSVNNLISTLGKVLQPILLLIMGLFERLNDDLLSPLIDTLGEALAVVVDLISMALAPLGDILSILFDCLSPILELFGLLAKLIMPLIQLALIPLRLAFQQISLPLQLLGSMLEWLAPYFSKFADIVHNTFAKTVDVINFVLGFVEDAVNGFINMLNGLIDGVNAVIGIFGGHIDKMKAVSLKIQMDTSSKSQQEDTLDVTMPDEAAGSGSVFDDLLSGLFGKQSSTQEGSSWLDSLLEGNGYGRRARPPRRKTKRIRNSP